MKKQKLIAFWKYDLCPYMLAGEIESFDIDGKVIIKNMQKMKFTPIAIIPDEAGLKAKKELEKLKHQYNVDDSKLKRKYEQKALDLIG